jgi:topoisomerase-4 subunit B
VKTKLDNAQESSNSRALLRKILQAERERKELSGIRKLATDRAKKANYNKKLRDCRASSGY